MGLLETVLSGAFDLGGAALSGSMNAATNRSMQRRQQAAMREQMALQYNYANMTRRRYYSDIRTSLERAGFNPVLALGNGTGGVASSGMVSGSSTGSGGGNSYDFSGIGSRAFQAGTSSAAQKAEQKKLEQDMELEKRKVDQDLKLQKDSVEAQIEKTKAETANLNADTVQTKDMTPSGLMQTIERMRDNSFNSSSSKALSDSILNSDNPVVSTFSRIWNSKSGDFGKLLNSASSKSATDSFVSRWNALMKSSSAADKSFKKKDSKVPEYMKASFRDLYRKTRDINRK